MKPRMPKYNYYLLNSNRKITFRSFTDIANEYGVGKGVVAGKFYRSKTNIITIKRHKIIRKLALDNDVD